MPDKLEMDLAQKANGTSDKNEIKKSLTEEDILKDNVSHNLKNLINRRGMTQKDLSDATGYCAAAVCRYFRASQFPPIDFLYQLKKLYGISIDDFISRKIYGNDTDKEPTDNKLYSAKDNADLDTARKYCGNYIVYYLDTSNYKGRDNTDAAEAIVYGVINIHEIQTNFRYDYKSFAILGLDNREKAEALKADLDSKASPDKISEFIDVYQKENGQSSVYTGDFDFGAKHAYISLRHGNIDRALIILYRIESNKSNYRGGLGVVNSGSKGREKMPTAQFIALSRYPISLSEEELHNELLLTYPRLKADDKNVTELISVFKKTFLSEDGTNSMFSEEQKEIMFKAFLENTIKTIVTSNMNRCAKASEKDDASWYKLVKREMDKQNNTPT